MGFETYSTINENSLSSKTEQEPSRNHALSSKTFRYMENREVKLVQNPYVGERPRVVFTAADVLA